MRGKNTIYINGQYYDAVTGLPVEAPTKTAPKTRKSAAKTGRVISDFGPAPSKSSALAAKKPVAATSKATTATTAKKPTVKRNTTPVKKVHSSPQRSQTLRRGTVKRPVGKHESTIRRSVRDHVATTKSPSITRFASHPIRREELPVAQESKPSILPTTRKPVIIQPTAVAKAHKTVEKKKAIPAKKSTSSRELKEQLIAEKLASIDTNKKPKEHKKVSRHKSLLLRPRTSSIIAACLAVVVLGGYLTYINMPSLSVRVAASQAGIDARFPEYRPDGYHFNGPIAYAPGEVTMSFQSNGSHKGYSITQKSSPWDSQAVLDNYILPKSDSYLTYSEQGLTVYTYGNHAAWVNGGLLYTIEGDAPLSNEQVLRIASSM